MIFFKKLSYFFVIFRKYKTTFEKKVDVQNFSAG